MKDTDKKEQKEREGIYLKEYGVWQDLDGTVRVPMKGFPIELFLQWNSHCVVRHGNCRWQKCVSDHEKARAYEAYIEQTLLNQGIEQRKSNDEKEDEGEQSNKLYR